MQGSLYFAGPAGFEYAEDLLSASEEKELISHVEKLPFKEFEFHGYLGKRRVVSYGWKYDYAKAAIREAPKMPDFLLAVRAKAAGLAGLNEDSLVQGLVTEYRPGTVISWHRDKSVFGDVVGISLLSPCTFRFRKKVGTKWERFSQTLVPRSGYVLRGEVRNEWEHSIPPVDDLRYSITFRTMR